MLQSAVTRWFSGGAHENFVPEEAEEAAEEEDSVEEAPFDVDVGDFPGELGHVWVA